MVKNNIPDELKIYELSLIWKEAEYNFAFWESLSGILDWDSAFKNALNAVLKTENLYEYYMELKKFVALLRDGHTHVVFPKTVLDSLGQLPIKTMLIKGELIISNVKRGTECKIKRWSIIKKIDGVNIEDHLAKNVYPYIWHEKKDSATYLLNSLIFHGPVGSEVKLDLESDGLKESVTLTRAHDAGEWYFDDVKIRPDEELRQVYSSDSHSISMTDDNIAVITIDTMMNADLPQDFYKNFPLLEKAYGYIIDVRENGGGNSDNANAVAAMFIGGEFLTQRALQPIHIGAYKAWALQAASLIGCDPSRISYEQAVEKFGMSEHSEKTFKIYKRMYYEESVGTYNSGACPGILTAPLIVLTSSNTASAAEDFLIELDYAKRATIVGTASFGSTGNPLVVDLESGGSFWICTRNCTYPDGREFINTGVQPHTLCEPTLAHYKNGVDSVMNKGLEVIRGQLYARK